MELNVLLVIIGILVWPELTFSIILWQLGYEALAIFAFIFLSLGTTRTRKIIKTRIIDRSGKIVEEKETEED